MFEKLRTILSRVDADYADIRYEIKKESIIHFEGKELTQIGSNSTDGYVLRVLKKGGLATAVFTKADGAEQAIRAAVENAGLIAQHIEKPIQMAGVFTHEAFGHFSEADIIETLPAMREKMQIGSKLGNDVLTIIDDATQPHQLGFYKYDDEGVPVRPYMWKMAKSWGAPRT